MTRTMRWIAAVSLVGLLLGGGARAQLSAEQIDALVEDAMSKFDVAGAAVGIVKDGKVVHAKGYGVRSIATKTPVDEHTDFAIASNTKAFTTTALAILVDEGRLRWRDRVKKYIPEFKMYDAYVTEHFNIEDLLTHRSGLGLGAGDLMFFPDGSDFTVHDVVTSFQHFKPQSEFRTKFDYDNLLYIVAGEVIARVTGTKWEDFVRKRILEPLGMKNTYCGVSELPEGANVATPHSTESGTIRTIAPFEIDPARLNGAPGAILSNVDDLCRWMLVHLNEGRYGESLKKHLFSHSRQEEMWTIRTTLPVSKNPRYVSHFSGYGLGWGLSDLNGNMSVSHTGGLPGMLSKTTLIPDLELGIVVLTNTSNGGAGLFFSVTQTILDSYLGLDDFHWTEKVLARQKARRSVGDEVTARVWETVEAARDCPVDVDRYVGVYEDKWFGKVEVFPKGEELWIRSYRSPKLQGRMHFYKANAFAVKWTYRDMNADAFVIFSLDEEGRAQRIAMKGISPNIDFSFDFQDLDLRRVEGRSR